MAGGILSANDAGSFWREAADPNGINSDDYLQSKYVKGAPTSQPPAGASSPPAGQSVTPAGQGVTVPNSNKFKTPANSLKKILDTIPPDDAGIPDHAHPGISSWLATPSNAAFAKSYFKPGNKALLQQVLGPDNYAKLIQHAPLPHSTALTTHAQKPAPNSNKYKTPTNGLKKLITGPGVTPKVVKGWVDAHPDYVKGYLTNPEYQDALKTDLGKNAYDLLQEHLKSLPEAGAAPAGPHATPEGSQAYVDKLKDNIQKNLPGYKPLTVDQVLTTPGGPHDWTQGKGFPEDKPAEQPTAPTAEPAATGNSPHYDNLKAYSQGAGKGVKDMLAAPGFHEWFHSHALVDQEALSKTPGVTAAKFQTWLLKHPQGAPPLSSEDQGEAEKVKELIPQIQTATPPEHSTAPPPGVDSSNSTHPALAAGIQKVFPDADIAGKSDAELKTQLQEWLKWLPEHKGDQDFSAHVPQLQKLYDQFFGQGGKAPQSGPSSEPPPELSDSPFGKTYGPQDIGDQSKAVDLGGEPASADKHQDLLDKINAIKPGWIKQKSWLEAQDKANNLSSAIKGWTSNGDLTPEQQAQFQQLHDEYFGSPEDSGSSSPAAAIVGEWPEATSGLQGKTSDEVKAQLQQWASPEFYGSAATAAKAKKYLQQYFGDDQGSAAPEQDLTHPTQYISYDKLKQTNPDSQVGKVIHSPSFDAWYQEYQAQGGKPEGLLKLVDKYQSYMASTGGEGEDEQQPASAGGVSDDLVGQLYDTVMGGGGKNPADKAAWIESVKSNAKSYANGNLDEYLSKQYPLTWKKFMADAEPADLGYGDEAYDTEPAGSPATSAPTKGDLAASYDPEQFAKDFAKSWSGGTAHNWAAINSGGQLYKDMSFAEAKADLEHLIAGAGDSNSGFGSPATKAVYDKYFGGSDESGLDDGAKSDYSKLVPDDMVYIPAAADITKLADEGKISQSAAKVLMDKPAGWWAEHYKNIENGTAPNTIWQQLLTIKPKGAGGGTGQSVPGFADSSTKGAVSFQQWLNNVYGSGNVTMDQANLAILHKSYATATGGVEQGTPGVNPHYQTALDSAATKGSLKDKVLHSPAFQAWFHQLSAADQQQYADNAQVGSQGGSSYITMFKKPDNAEAYAQALAQANAGTVADTASPVAAGPPPFDSEAFKNEFAALFPGSGWIKQDGDKDPVEAQQKLKGLVDSADANFAGTEKTQQAHALYDKYFGDGKSYGPKAPAGGYDPTKLSNGDISQIKNMSQYGSGNWTSLSKDEQKQKLGELIQQHHDDGYDSQAQDLQDVYDKYFGAGSAKPETLNAPQVATEPEEEAGVSPSKSEPATPEEVASQAGAKPTTGTDFKNFAKWWGAKQLSPQDEADIYHAWFPHKAQATPEQAGKWFQAVFEHYSKPGSDDLTATSMPQWAANSWALGKDATAQWPIFQQWAATDPGLPKGSSIKAKLAIWKGLSAGDQKEIEQNYHPSHPVDAKALVGALAAAYPDSDWKTWSAMPQGTLKNNVELLAKSGYEKAIPLYNQFYDGHVPMPVKAAEESPAAQPVTTIPIHQLPSWVQNSWGSTGPAAIQYTGLKHMAEAMGQGELAEKGDPEAWHQTPNALVQLFNKMPQYLKDQVASTNPTELPFHDQEGYEAWLAAQPNLKDVFAGGLNTTGSLWSSGNTSYFGSKKKQVEQALQKMADYGSDPALFAQTLNDYNTYFGNSGPTLAQALKAVYPTGPAGNGGLKKDGADWDVYLKTHSKADVAKLIKKQFKAEADPEKWIQLVDLWPKYLGGNTGHAKLTPALKYTTPGQGLGADSLKALKYWKDQLGGNTSVDVPWAGQSAVKDYDAGPYLKSLAQEPTNAGALYYGWTPPGHLGGGYVADPAQLGASGVKQYAAPAVADKKGKQYQGLLDKITSSSASYSKADQELATSEEFASWFQQAPSGYKDAFQHNPGIALDDFKAFTEGDLGTEVPADYSDAKVYDVSPFGNVPKSKDQVHLPTKYGPKSYPKAENGYLESTDYDPFGHNKQRGDDIKFPQKPDDQEPLPGVHWAPQYKAMPIYRVMQLDLKNQDSDPAREQVRKQIVDILTGKKPKDKPAQPTLFDDQKSQTWPKDAPPVPKTPDQWMAVLDWAKKNGVSGEQMYDLAEQAGATPGKFGQPPLANQAANWEDPRLGKLLLDYMERPHKNNGGLGIHWTRSRKKAYEGVPSAGAYTNNSSLSKLVVSISGLWGGQGEDPTGRGGAYPVHNQSELEHTLLAHAPVHIRRLQIRSPDDDWHDTIDYGPMSLWDEGRDEDSKDKPSLAKELHDKIGGTYSAADYDALTPGHQADAAFDKLVAEHPEAKAKIEKIYQHYFVGRPDLTTKPHTRQASLARPTVRTIEAVFETLAYAEGEDNGWGDSPSDVWTSSAPMNLKSPLYPSKPWDTSDQDNPRPAMHGAPGDRNDHHFYFSPHEVNPRPDTNARPHVEFPREQLPQDPLPDMPTGHGDLPLHRGYGLEFAKDSPLSRAMDQYEPEDPRIRDLILDHLGENGLYYGPHQQFDLGSHWTTDKGQADRFAENNNEADQIPVSVSTGWHGTGEDPYRSDTFGDYPSEHEVTLLPGAKAPVSALRYRSPKSGQWHEFSMDQPVDRVAALELRILQAELDLVAPEKMWNNFGELDAHHPGTGAGMFGHEGPPVQHKKMWSPKKLKDVEAAIERLAVQPTPAGLQMHYWPDSASVRKAYGLADWDGGSFMTPAVTAHLGEGPLKDTQVGSLEWYPGGYNDPNKQGEVSMISTHPDWQRHGIGTAMFDHAKQFEPKLHHSELESGAGNDWARAEESRSGGPQPPSSGPKRTNDGLWVGSKLGYVEDLISILEDM